jgi:hypothetical protein
VALVTHKGFTLDVPTDWNVQLDADPIALMPPFGDAPVQVSWLSRPLEKRREPTEKSAAAWANRIADRLTGGDVRTPPADVAGDVTSGARVVRAETWPAENSVCAGMDLEPPAGEETNGAYFAAGFREWLDVAMVLTWIGDAATVSYRRGARSIFESTRRAR